MIPAIILSLGMMAFPESPRYLFDRGLWVQYIFSFSREVWKCFTFSESEALQVLADLHGEGDKSNELVVLEYEGIRQQVRFSTTGKIFDGNTTHFISVFGRFTLSALKVRNHIWTYWSLATLVVSCSEWACKCGLNFAAWTWWCTSW